LVRIFTTARRRSSTFIYACPTNETIHNLKSYALKNNIPNPTGFSPNPRFHLTLLRCGEIFELEQPDIHHYDKPVVCRASQTAPDTLVPAHKGWAIVGVRVSSTFFDKRRTNLHTRCKMRIPEENPLHLVLSYNVPVQTVRALPPLGFDLVFDHERVDDFSGWVRPREVQEPVARRQRDVQAIRSLEIRR
jgi:hypothetical protein